MIGKCYAARVRPFLLILLLKMPGRIKLKNNLSVCFVFLDGSDTQAWASVTSHAHRSSSPTGGSVFRSVAGVPCCQHTHSKVVFFCDLTEGL